MTHHDTMTLDQFRRFRTDFWFWRNPVPNWVFLSFYERCSIRSGWRGVTADDLSDDERKEQIPPYVRGALA